MGIVSRSISAYVGHPSGGPGSPGGEMPTTVPVSRRGLLKMSTSPAKWVVPIVLGGTAVACAIFVPGCLQVEAGLAFGF
jgi:hypothetical protein